MPDSAQPATSAQPSDVAAVLDGLDEQQQAAVAAPRGPVCVLAGAGTGKTRTITRRIAHLVEHGHTSPGQVLAVTFTSRAAGEMRTRLRGLGIGGVQARTFHAAALRQLRYFWPQVVGDTPWELLDRKFSLVGQAASRVGAKTSTENVRDLAGEIEWAKATLIAPEDYPAAAVRARRDPPGSAEQVSAVYAGYEALKARSGQLDFDDLLLHTAAALEEHSAVAEEFRDRYRCFVVDEYQDVTPLQQRVLDAWLGERDDLTVVGDANQTIYSFTGATPRYLLDFSRRFPEATVVRLERDYRSTPQVVSLANRVIGAAKGRVAGSRLQLIGQRPNGVEPHFSEHDDESAEATAVAARIKKLIEAGTPAAEIAVLYRINAQSEVHEQALTELGIPYQVRGGDRFFERPEVRQAVQVLRKAEQNGVGQAGGGGEAGDDPVDLIALVRALLEPVGLTAQAPSGGNARDRWESLLALVQVAEELVAHEPRAGLARLISELASRAESRHPPVVQGVTLSSLHAAKGLEWDAVFLVGLVEGTLPIQHALGEGGAAEEAAVEEERRLLYVGVTRAREVLCLSWALSRNPGGRKSRRRSRFLQGLVPADSPAARTPSRPEQGSRSNRKRAVCRVCNAVLTGTLSVKLGRCEDCPSDLDDELLEALKDWRRERSAELKVPAYVVFTDATLTAIAEQQPTTDAALVAIPGIGAAKLERFGAEVLGLVKADRSTSDA
ncbi:ATP-dependent DNA helicase UvrD2 [Rhodococcus sp. X156]|uniref:ATP-dependent DNA helicase UvrD2 n=1 Tax=Rhodococcus sp. X156 TaxID=2499145 RepID=UPI000FD9349F|nr:ATP-dependent DNA helicase UvrD2 [Rhodococcus sp. X156]